MSTVIIADTFKASNGVVLKLKRVSRFAIVEAGRKIPVPKVPTTYVADKDRQEENPNDPDYIAALAESNYQRSMMTITASLVLGTEIISLPKGMPGPEDDEWYEVLDALDITVPKDNKRLRYSAWLKYVCLADEEFMDLMNLVLKFSGLVTEQDVAQAQDAFRGATTRPADLSVPPTAENPSGNHH